MYYTPLCLALTILATLVAGALVDRSAPYFPIEISRTATGRLSSWVFRLGLTASVASLLLESDDWLRYACSALGVLLLAWIDDETSHTWHMAGVVMLGVGALFSVVTHWSRASAVMLACAAGVWTVRLVMKWAAVAWIEKGGRAPLDFAGIGKTAMHIMYTGHVVDSMTLHIFRVAGVLQWVALAMVYCVCVDESK